MVRSASSVVGTVAAGFLLLAWTAPAMAAPVTVDFESGPAPGTVVTNQYCCPGGVEKGPTFKKGTSVGFNAGSQPGLSGLSCEPPHLDASDQAHSGSRAIILDGCASGEFTHSAAFFQIAWPTDSVEFQVGLPSETPSSCPNFICAEIWTTAFRKDGSIVMQQQTLLGPNTTFKGVPLTSAEEDIAFVAIERGTKETPTDSATGVMLAPISGGTGALVVDDLTYDPPSSPPESSFVLGASPPSTRLAPGTKSPQIKVLVTWFANPNPSASLVSMELTAPAGIAGTFVPNPTGTGESTLVLEAAKYAAPGKYTVTVDGYVDKGEPSEKHSSVQIPVEVTEPFTLETLGDHTAARCTPTEVPIRIAKDPGIADPFQVDVYIEGGPTKFVGTSAGTIVGPHHVSATLNQPGNEATMTVTVGIDLDALAERDPIVVEAAPSGYAPREAKGTVTAEPIRIDSISPSPASAAQLGKQGSLVTVKGAGFCPGDKVALGPVEDTANPDSISTPGNTLTFRVPRAAVSGPLWILPLKGTPLAGPVLPISTFRDTWGYSWLNQDYGMRLTSEMMDELFGVEETNINVLGWLIRKPEAGLFGEITNKHIPGGICFGMAYGVAQTFDSPNWVQEFPRSGNTVWSLDERKAPSSQLLRWVTQRFSLQFTDELIPVELGQFTGQLINAHDPTTDIEEIKSLVGPGKPPLMLGLMHWAGGFEAHSVLAYDWEPGPNDTTIVYVYNPNMPYLTGEASNFGEHEVRELTESQIVVRNSDSYWKFPQLKWEGPDYHLILFPHEKLPILNGESPHIPNVFVGVGLFVFGSSGDSVTGLGDGHGHRMVVGGAPADPKSWPPGVAPIPSYTGAPASLQMVATNPRKAGGLSATVRRAKGGGTMEMSLPGLQASLRAGAHRGQVDHVTVDDGSRAIGYSPGADTSFGGTLTSAPGGAAAAAAAGRTKSERLVRFETTATRGEEERVAFTGGRAFAIVHEGAPAPLSLTLSSFGTDGLPVAIRLPKVHLPRGARLHVAPSDWRRLGAGRVRMTMSVGGHARTRLVRGRRVGRAFALPRGATVADGGSRLSLAVPLKHQSPGSWVSPTVRVLRGGRLVAKSMPAQFSGPSMRRESLALDRRLRPGRYRVRIGLLETVVEAPSIQSSVVVRKSLPLRIR